MSNGFLASVKKLLMGQFLAQGISIIGMLLAAWLYGAATFGEYSFIWLIATTIGSFASLRYERALLVPGSSKNKLVLIVYILSLFCCTLSLFGFYLGTGDVTLAVLSSAFVLVFSLVQLYVQLRIRDEEYSAIANGDVVHALALVFFQVLFFYLLSSAALSLMLASVVTKIMHLYILFKEKPNFKLEVKNILLEAKKHYRFPIYSVPNSLMTIAPMRTVMVVAGLSLSSELYGFLTIAQRIVMLPVTAIANAIRRVFVSTYSKGKSNGAEELNAVFFGLATRVGLLTALMLAVGIVGSTIELPFSRHDDFVKYSLVFLPIASVYLLFSWMDRIYEVESQQHVSLILEGVSGVFLISLFFLVNQKTNLDFALFVFAWSTVFYNYVWLFVTFSRSMIGFESRPSSVSLVGILVFVLSVTLFTLHFRRVV